MHMNLLGSKVKKIRNECIKKMGLKGIIENENNGAGFHSFESIPI